MDFLRDCFTLVFFFGVFAALLWHTIRVEFGFLFRDNAVIVKPKAVQRKPSPVEVAAARRRLALAKE
jgi:hypothetical protein